MAPNTRARRQADMPGFTTKAKLSTAADGDPTAPPPGHINDDDRRKSRDANRGLDEAGDSQHDRPWTPEPEPYDAEEYTAWGRKHYGDDWCEQRDLMLRERNFYDTGVDKFNDRVYLNRQRALRKMEREREEGKLPLTKGKTWVELMAWARTHYGEAWWAQRAALDRDEREKREALDPDERKRKSSKAAKRWLGLREMQRAGDERVLAQGKTWHEIMARAAEPRSTPPPVEAAGDVVSSPSAGSEHSDGSGYSTYPPTPTDARRQAISGPQGQGGELDWQWDFVEWNAVRNRLSETEYEETKAEVAVRARSRREDEECERRRSEEWEAIRALKWTDQNQYYLKKEQLNRRVRDLDRRLHGWTQERIDAMHREEAAHTEQVVAAALLAYDAAAQEQPTDSLPNCPLTQEEFDARHRDWDALGLSREEQAELVRVFGFVVKLEQESGGAHAATAETAEAPRPRASPRPTKATSRKTRGGRITKNAAQSKDSTCRGSRSRQPAPISAPAPAPGRGRIQPRRAPVVPDEPGVGTARAQPQHGVRRSRRLAGKLPEFDMLPGRGGRGTLQQPSDTGLSKKAAVVEGGRPRGISKPRPDGAGRSRRLTKQSRA